MNWVKREARRVRVRSIILSGHRKRDAQWDGWICWEIFKSLIRAYLLLPIDALVFPVPHLLYVMLIAACFAHTMFVLFHAGTVALRLNKRRGAFLEASGYDLTISSVLTDAWKHGFTGGTLRDFLVTRRPKSKVRQPHR
jgi:hypothetical protein